MAIAPLPPAGIMQPARQQFLAGAAGASSITETPVPDIA
jgi:hypothetical protein